ncbi:MAG TPA: SDR family NAD(P)-dependent oxidoreductase [Sphingobium sp.]|nr:SDR family NAD(P)-dependent oxidoreductase [Sphingobium sp.]
MTRTFNGDSTTDDVLEGMDLAGKRVLVTGVSAGLGTETARALVAHGADVVGTARNLDKARAATAGIVAGPSGGSLDLVELDLASLASVRACADQLLADGRSFDVVIANAGVMACPEGRTVDGFETQFGTNHLGHFLLINRIAPLIASDGRVVVLSSGAHRLADIDLDDPNFERTPYRPFVAYGRSKTANALFALAFDRRHRDRGIRAASVHPGGIQTELGRHSTEETRQEFTQLLVESGVNANTQLRLKSVPQGAATSVWAGFVAGPEEIGGRYCEDCGVAETIAAGSERRGVRPYALDPERAEALWAKSEDMVGERF